MSNLYVDTELLVKNEEFKIKFGSIYPDLNLNILDKSIIIDIALDMYHRKIIDLPKSKVVKNEPFNIFDSNDIDGEVNNLIQEYGVDSNYKKINEISLNRIKADNKIPELFVPGELIIINGSLNNKEIKIFVDTGASFCCITKTAVKKCELLDLVDTSTIFQMKGSSNTTDTYGKIWYNELAIKDINNSYTKFPISFEVIDDIIDTFDIVLGNNFLRTYNANLNFSNRIISFNTKENDVVITNYI
jgi:hypothetical protein